MKSKGILKRTRSVEPVNRFFRKFFKKIDKGINWLISKWPVYGVTELQFDNIPFKMYSEGDDHIVQLLYYNRSYHESKDLHLFLQLARQANVVFDIGANTGVYSILTNRANPAVKVYSFEPYPVNVDRLKRNLALNGTNAEVVEKAIGDKAGVVSFAVPDNGNISDTSSAEIDFSKKTYGGNFKWKTIEVGQVTLDSFLSEPGISRVGLVKIDVEGYEEAVFRGATEFFKQHSPVIQCEILLDEKRKIFFENFLKENGYNAYLILNEGLLRVDQEMEQNPGSLNYLFSKGKTIKQFTSFTEMGLLVEELCFIPPAGANNSN